MPMIEVAELPKVWIPTPDDGLTDASMICLMNDICDDHVDVLWSGIEKNMSVLPDVLQLQFVEAVVAVHPEMYSHSPWRQSMCI